MWIKNKIKNLLKPVINVNINQVNDSNLLYDKTAIVFGGTGGIGYEIINKLVLNGCKNVICCGRSNIKFESDKVEFVQWDLMDYN